MIVRRYYKYRWSIAVREDLMSHKALADKMVSYDSFFRKTTIIELAIALIQPLPFTDFRFSMRAGFPILNYEFTLSEMVYVFMYLKLYIILRYIVSSSVYTNSDAKSLWYPGFLLTLVVWSNTISLPMPDMPSSA